MACNSAINCLHSNDACIGETIGETIEMVALLAQRVGNRSPQVLSDQKSPTSTAASAHAVYAAEHATFSNISLTANSEHGVLVLMLIFFFYFYWTARHMRLSHRLLGTSILRGLFRAEHSLDTLSKVSVKSGATQDEINKYLCTYLVVTSKENPDSFVVSDCRFCKKAGDIELTQDINICAICLSTFSDAENGAQLIRVLPCKHIFHRR